MKNEFFYIRRWKARRKEWYVAFRNTSNSDSAFELLEDKNGNAVESDYACLANMIKELLMLEQATIFKIVHKKDLIFLNSNSNK